MSCIEFQNEKIAVGKVVCVGRNYLEHIHELNNAIPEQMVVFNKPGSAITSQLSSYHQEILHYEAEISFLVHEQQYVGVGLGLDLTKRQLQQSLKNKGLPWERAKAFDGSVVFSRFLSLDKLDLDKLHLELFINCVRVQTGGVEQMIYHPQTILDEVSQYSRLQDGDIVMTGTPKGVGEIHAGDIFLGRLKYQNQILLEIEWVAQ